ncbi:hypothetical protein [Cytobacillus oceanisediminis]|uniref:hypothetical protein n=1 Tax=Cytobacillus oceanisediminis TaxID=665099 RepID=UPI002079A7A0|nr:hypothetical protein [Cytobacillus oceanisediminis]USK44660.1 hypothetical protein LIT27_01825 [Cytobacillus oceanisediminis]
MKKKLSSVLMVCLLSVFAFGSSTFAADPAGWQLIDDATYQHAYTGPVTFNGAEGGNAKFCLKTTPGTGMYLKIYEDDGYSSNTLIHQSYFSPGECWTFDVDPYVDGSDNDAEFLVQLVRGATGNVVVQLWD